MEKWFHETQHLWSRRCVYVVDHTTCRPSYQGDIQEKHKVLHGVETLFDEKIKWKQKQDRQRHETMSNQPLSGIKAHKESGYEVMVNVSD